MKPILFTIGPFNVYSFGVLLALAFILATFIVWKLGRDELREEEYLDGFLVMFVISIFTARIVYILFNWNVFGLNILKYILVRETPGLSLLGGLAGGFLYLLYFARQKKYQLYHVLDVFSLPVSFSLVFAKIGQLLGGGGFGRETDSLLGVRIIGLPGRRHPVELYEAFFLLLMSISLLFIYNKLRRVKGIEGLIFYSFLFFMSLTIFLLEFLKVGSVYLYGLSLRQITAIGIVILVCKPLLERIRFIRMLKKEKHV